MHTHRRCRFRALSSSLARTRRRRRRRLPPAAFPRRSLLRKFKEATTFQRPVSWFFPDHVPRSIFTGPFSLQGYVGASGLRRMVCMRTGDADFVHFLLLLYEFDVAVGGVFVPQRSRDDRSCANSRKRRLSSVRCHGCSPDHVLRSTFTGPFSLQGYVGASGLRRMVCIRTGDADSVQFLLLLYGFRRRKSCRLRPAAFPRRLLLRKFKEATTFQRPVSWFFPDQYCSVDIYRSVFASGLRRRFRVT